MPPNRRCSSTYSNRLRNLLHTRRPELHTRYSLDGSQPNKPDRLHIPLPKGGLRTYSNRIGPMEQRRVKKETQPRLDDRNSAEHRLLEQAFSSSNPVVLKVSTRCKPKFHVTNIHQLPGIDGTHLRQASALPDDMYSRLPYKPPIRQHAKRLDTHFHIHSQAKRANDYRNRLCPCHRCHNIGHVDGRTQ